MRRLLFPVFAVAMAASAALLVNAWLENQKRAALADVQPVTVVAEPAYIEVLVAGERLTPGSFVKPGALQWQKWPDVQIPATYIVRGHGDATAFEGAVVRQLLAPGDPIIAESLISPGDRGFLAAVLDPDMRAISVPVDEASSNAGLIFPGDRVDLILTQSVAPAGDRASARRVSETVLENLRVIAMGRRLHTDPEDDLGSGPIRTATLEVSPEGAEVVALVTELGKLSLSLRSIASAGLPAGRLPARRAVTWDSDISRVLDDAGRPTSTLVVMRGASSERLQASEGSPQ
jgi:pilus assembly protein CpaB